MFGKSATHLSLLRGTEHIFLVTRGTPLILNPIHVEMAVNDISELAGKVMPMHNVHGLVNCDIVVYADWMPH